MPIGRLPNLSQVVMMSLVTDRRGTGHAAEDRSGLADKAVSYRTAMPDRSRSRIVKAQLQATVNLNAVLTAQTATTHQNTSE